jgi:cell wall-associated NlpC family hydrolase
MVVEWTLAEDSGSGAFERNNPLNTTQPGFAENVTINSDGVKGYETREAGLSAAVHTITNGLYNDVVAALLANDAESAKRALWASPWAGSHYGYGASWPAYQMEGTQVARVSSIRAELVTYALSLDGIPYVRGGRSATGGDCSGTMQHVFLTVAGIDIGATTFSQYPQLQPIDESELQPGDLWFGQYSNDQHVGMVADVDGDSRWDLINNGGLASSMHVDYGFQSIDYFAAHTMGYRRAL